MKQKQSNNKVTYAIPETLKVHLKSYAKYDEKNGRIHICSYPTQAKGTNYTATVTPRSMKCVACDFNTSPDLDNPDIARVIDQKEYIMLCSGCQNLCDDGEMEVYIEKKQYRLKQPDLNVENWRDSWGTWESWFTWPKNVSQYQIDWQ